VTTLGPESRGRIEALLREEVRNSADGFDRACLLYDVVTRNERRWRRRVRWPLVSGRRGLVGIRCDRPGQGPLGVKQGGQAGVTRWAESPSC
jgi:hypothetical protein